MAVYVDQLVNSGKRIGRAGPEWCHLAADTPQELHAFAARLRLGRSYAQHEGLPTLHYDLTRGKRAQAVRLGAIEIASREMGRQISERMEWR
jgi:hypothetical protein